MATQIFQLFTLVDITATGVVRSNGNRDLERNQQRNFETVLQVLSLRTQPHVIKFPETIQMDEHRIAQWFGEMYHGHSHTVWAMYFTADHPGAYDTEEGTLAGLGRDFEQVPIVTDLTETARFILPIFYPHGSIKNILLKAIPNA